ncbi:FAD/NAD(P)-binding domain-containing protein [Corynespora cassiicola Philippines]|uniref:FAD/NAD(P)-binding domain-containing protein n=1 Tax=Corynespora cassiicola Philippines TaxID=1448308 RepID=A0A2T2N8U7_CORCC|nr:FAD/NAD(P)-binding domain-containing protein [Corynespora cassiicola Philippines]
MQVRCPKLKTSCRFDTRLTFEKRPLYPTNSLKFLDKLSGQNGHHVANDAVHTRPRLEVIVVGAGLGGLATAVALQLYGHRVTVLEQAPFLAEVGAGIQIPPNSGRHLHDWGLEHRLAAVGTRPDAMTFRRWENGNAIGHTDLGPEYRAKFHAPYYVIHRADFHEILHARAIELGVDMHLSSKVTSYDPDGPAVSTDDGRVFKGDLVVAADGIKSIARSIIDSSAEDAKPTGFAAYRATALTETMRKDPDTAWLLERPDLNIWIGDGRHVMSYMISGGKTFNMVLVHRDTSDPSAWNAASARRDMEEQFQGWDRSLTKVISQVDRFQKWPLMTGGRQSRWVAESKKMLILGDAAHAMLPFMSQGAAMAVEDAAALATALHHAKGKGDIARVLDVFESVRRLRTQQMQQASSLNAELWHFCDGPEQRARDEAMEAEVLGLQFKQSANQWSDPVTQRWAYGFDAAASVHEQLEADGRCGL